MPLVSQLDSGVILVLLLLRAEYRVDPHLLRGTDAAAVS